MPFVHANRNRRNYPHYTHCSGQKVGGDYITDNEGTNCTSSSSSSSSSSQDNNSNSSSSSSSLIDISSSSSSSSFLDFPTYRVTGCDTAEANGDYVLQNDGLWMIALALLGWNAGGTRYRYRKVGTNYYIGYQDTSTKWYIVETSGSPFTSVAVSSTGMTDTPPEESWTNNAVISQL